MRFLTCLLLLAMGSVGVAPVAAAAPVVSTAQLVDVTDRSFAVVWTTDRPATGSLRLYADESGTSPVVPRAGLRGGNADDPPTQLGVLRVRAAGLDAQSVVYYQTETTEIGTGAVTLEPSAPPYPSVTLQRAIYPVLEQDYLGPEVNDLLPVEVGAGTTVGIAAPGSVVLLTTPQSAHPISAVAEATGSGSVALLDLNNLFDENTRETLFPADGSAVEITVQAGWLGTDTANAALPASSGSAIAQAGVVPGLTAAPPPGAPVVTPPPDLMVEATAVLTPVDPGTASALDDVDGPLPAVTHQPGPFPLGMHTITWLATDSAGNTGNAQQILVVEDTTPPVLTVPPDLTVQSEVPLSLDPGTATATDIFGVVVVDDAPDPFPLGPTTVTYTATDDNGNVSTGAQLVTIVVPTPILSGDINGDGKLDVGDVVLAMRIASGAMSPSPEELERGDVAPLVDGMPAPDGVIDVGDVSVLMRAVAGAVTLP